MAVLFTVLVISLVVWALIYAIQLAQTTLESQLLWQGLTLSSAGLYRLRGCFSLVYIGREEWFTRRRIALLVSEPIGFLALCLTNPIHQLI